VFITELERPRESAAFLFPPHLFWRQPLDCGEHHRFDAELRLLATSRSLKRIPIPHPFSSSPIDSPDSSDSRCLYLHHFRFSFWHQPLDCGEHHRFDAELRLLATSRSLKRIPIPHPFSSSPIDSPDSSDSRCLYLHHFRFSFGRRPLDCGEHHRFDAELRLLTTSRSLKRIPIPHPFSSSPIDSPDSPDSSDSRCLYLHHFRFSFWGQPLDCGEHHRLERTNNPRHSCPFHERRK